MPVRPWPGSICVAPAAANIGKISDDVVPGALISILARPAFANASAARPKVTKFGVGFTVPLA